MVTPNRSCGVFGCKLEVPESLQGQGLCLDHYVEVAFQKLDLATDNSRTGSEVDRKTLEWLLAQIDCIVEITSEETAALSPETHSKLLELLLGIANLNEYVRHRTILSRHMGT